MLATPRFHHLHLRVTEPERMIAFYVRQFPSSTAGVWAGLPALFCPNDVMILFEPTPAAAPTFPQSAIWHFGWHVTDVRAAAAGFATRPDVTVAPLYTGVEDGWVTVSSDTWFKTGDLLGVTPAQIAAFRAAGTPPPGGPGFAYFRAPDGALFEIAGDYKAERFNHIHMWQEEPLCAQLWYQRHLHAPGRASFGAITVTEATCKVPRTTDRTFPALPREGMLRAPRGGVTFGDIDVIWYANQGHAALAPSIGQYQDHFALAVADLDAWIAKLRGDGVTILCEPYGLGNTRAAMIEGPSREGIELVEA
jgi:catechol 2,3-dioxygenase-like lactoylglutathione lyase family enzyme